MVHSHINLTTCDVHNHLFKYIDRYFEIRFGNVLEDQKVPIRANEKGALQGYLQSFDDKNLKWINRINLIKNELLEKYKKHGTKIPYELQILDSSKIPDLRPENRITLPLKSFYLLGYSDLLENNDALISYDENGYFEKLNLSHDKLKSAISLFALTATLANRVAHASQDEEEIDEAFNYKHKMITFLLTSVYDYNKSSSEKIDCKFAKVPSSSDGHSYPAFTLKLSSPENLGKISLHFGGTLRYFKHAFRLYS